MKNLIDSHGIIHKGANLDYRSTLSVCEEYMDHHLQDRYETSCLGRPKLSYFMYDLQVTRKRRVTCVMCLGASP